MSTAARCVDDADLVLFADGQLTPERARGIEAHVDVCVECRHALSSLAHGLTNDRRRTASNARRALTIWLGVAQAQ